ncbi:ras-related protein Rap-2a-like [Ruditapes philippinarum]|uniref:ras-related protein Rap-2a-like n=1 Tax=Ruditapes philippinarum TaxID=129788 RepID=UPI00295C33DB|nr:ras-related protein Rap-2a-like [Ruditapes philippinarum]
MSFDQPPRGSNYRVVVMGTAGVGKSSIISQFMHNKFTETHKETVEELHRHRMKFKTIAVEIDILDTSGSHEFPAMRKLAIATGDAFILVYAVDNQTSFETVKRLRDEIKEYNHKEHYSIVVVANKTDLEEKREPIINTVNESVVCIDWEEKFVFTSAKTGENVDIVFQLLENQIKARIHLEEKRLSFFRRISMPIMKLAKPERTHAPKLNKQSRTCSFGGFQSH